MFRITVIFTACILAFSLSADCLLAKQPSVRRSANAVRNYVGGTPERSVTLTDRNASRVRSAVTPSRGNVTQSLLPGVAGRATTPGKLATPRGLSLPRPSLPSRLATRNVLNNILPQAISAGTQIINRIKERDSTPDVGERSLFSGRARRARGPLFEPMSPQFNAARQSYGTGESETSSLLDGDNPPTRDQVADDGSMQSNAPTEAPQLPADTRPVSPPIVNTAANPVGGKPGSLGELLARDDARMFQHYMENLARSTTKYNDALDDYYNDTDSNYRYPRKSTEEYLRQFRLLREQYYIDQIAALRQLEESIMYADFAKQRIAGLKAQFKKEQEVLNKFIAEFK